MDIQSRISKKIAVLGFMSVKRIILKNWKIRKTNCFDIYNWVKDFMNLLSMENVFSHLSGPYDNQTNDMSLQDIMNDIKKKLAHC